MFIVWKALCYNNTLKIKDRFNRVPAIASAVCPCFRTDKLPLLVLVLARVCQLCLSFWIINSHMMDSLNRSFNFHCSNLSCGLYCFLSPTVWGFALFLLSSKTLSYFIRLFGLSLSPLLFLLPHPSTNTQSNKLFPENCLRYIPKICGFFFHLTFRILKSSHSFPQGFPWSFKNILFTLKYLCSFYPFCHHCFPVLLH